MRPYMLLTIIFTGSLLAPFLLCCAFAVSHAENDKKLSTATFAGGCFWCMQPPFDELEGVVSTTVGYTGGHKVRPTYEEVSAGATGHAEAIQILYDPEKISYPDLLEVFWHNVDPFDAHGQFCDRGSQYRSAIFYHDEEQGKQAQAAKARLQTSLGANRPVVTEIVPGSEFFPAEEYHQDYYRKNPVRYKFYRYGCGRDKRLKEIWRNAAGD